MHIFALPLYCCSNLMQSTSDVTKFKRTRSVFPSHQQPSIFRIATMYQCFSLVWGRLKQSWHLQLKLSSCWLFQVLPWFVAIAASMSRCRLWAALVLENSKICFNTEDKAAVSCHVTVRFHIVQCSMYLPNFYNIHEPVLKSQILWFMKDWQRP